MHASQKIPQLLRLTNLLAFLALAAAFGLVMFYAPVEIDMGLVQKVFYFHVACTWTGMLGFLLSFAAAVAYLKTGDPKWDIAGLAGIEIGMVFVGLGVLSGSMLESMILCQSSQLTGCLHRPSRCLKPCKLSAWRTTKSRRCTTLACSTRDRNSYGWTGWTRRPNRPPTYSRRRSADGISATTRAEARSLPAPLPCLPASG